MEILGVGPLELLMILVLALAVFGPDKLPQIGARLGKGLRSLRQTTRQFSAEIEQTRQAIEAPMREAGRPIQEVVQPFGQITAGVQDAVQIVTDPGEALRQAAVRELAQPEPEESPRQVGESTSQQAPAGVPPEGVKPVAAERPRQGEA